MNRPSTAIILGASLAACSAPAPEAEISAPKATALEHDGPDVKQTAPDLKSDDGMTESISQPTSTTVAVTPAQAEAPIIPAWTMPPEPIPVELPEDLDDLSDSQWWNREGILACIRSYEGDYDTETGNGHHGAYQFTQGTWDGAVARAGYPQYVGSRAGDTPPHVQDAAAWQLYQERGFQPWPPASRYCSA